MKKLDWTRLASRTALVLVAASSVALAGPAPKPTKDRFQEDSSVDGRARVAREAFVRDARSHIVEVPVTVDISKVLRDGRLAVLGAYVARVDFGAGVELIGVRQGADKHFAQPTFTSVENANKWGFVKIVDDNGDVDEPTGSINVAVARFRVKNEGAEDSIHVTFESLATSLLRDGSGNILMTDMEIPVAHDEKDARYPLVAINPLTGPGSERATPGTSSALANFVFFGGVQANGSNGSATDNCTPAGSLTRLAPQRAGVDITNTTAFSPGVNTVTFRFQDAASNIGSATSNATVEIWGDADTNYSINSLDLTFLRQNLAGSLPCGVPPATPRCDRMDNDRNSVVNSLDLTRLRQYLALNLPCLI